MSSNLLKVSFKLALIFIISLATFSSCKKEVFNTSSSVDVRFSVDTLLFDTVFTTVGSITKRVKVYNNEDESVILSSVYVKGNSQGKFAVNVDGNFNPGNVVKDLEIFPKDSIFIFVETKIDGSSANLPFIVEDELVMKVNGNTKKVQLVAWGQNAHFYNINARDSFYTDKGDTLLFSHYQINQDVTLSNDLPHVFYRSLVVRNGATLTINPGTRIHMNSNSNIIVHQGGKINIKGSGFDANRVIIAGKRLDDDFVNRPGEWGVFRICQDAGPCTIENAIIKNGTIGLYLGGPYIAQKYESSFTPEVSIKNSIIRNMSQHGTILQSGKASVENSEISDCGDALIFAYIGGEYQLNQLTLANYYSSRSTPSLIITNHNTDEEKNIYEKKDLTLHLSNSIVYGSYTNELAFDKKEGVGFDVVLENDLIRFDNEDIDTNDANVFKNCWFNENPEFVETYSNFLSDYQLDTLSFAKDKGNINLATPFPTDLNGNSRLTDGKPDLGAYERQE
jgi:hypothetical protein